MMDTGACNSEPTFKHTSGPLPLSLSGAEKFVV